MTISPETRDVADRAKAIYQARLRVELERTHMNYFVAIEPDSGDYFLGKTMGEASQAAHKAYPNRRTFMERVGHCAAVDLSNHIEILRRNAD